MVGKINDPFQGCACSLADVTRGLVARLSLMDNEILLIDMEAGVESFGRGVERSVDLVLSIVEPSFESMALAKKIVYLNRRLRAEHIGSAVIVERHGLAQFKHLVGGGIFYGLFQAAIRSQPDGLKCQIFLLLIRRGTRCGDIIQRVRCG